MMYSSAMFCHSIFTEPEIKSEPDIFPYNSSENMSENGFQEEFQSHDNEEPDMKKGKQQKCNVCGKILSSASSYYVHLKQHSNNKPYQCTLCDASFCRKPYLEVHMRTHTGERPFECEVCKKRFTQKSSLNTHKRSHTGLRPYACDICLKRFSVKSYLSAHQWSHAAANGGVVCSMCDLPFSNKSQYFRHLRTHNSKGFECEYCPRVFSKESYLIRHKTRLHVKIEEKSAEKTV